MWIHLQYTINIRCEPKSVVVTQSKAANDHIRKLLFVKNLNYFLKSFFEIHVAMITYVTLSANFFVTKAREYIFEDKLQD